MSASRTNAIDGCTHSRFDLSWPSLSVVGQNRRSLEQSRSKDFWLFVERIMALNQR
jgi:hypothetical protein